MSNAKTNAMRLLDKEHIEYEVLEYDHGLEAVDGLSVANMLHQNPDSVFKTLVTIANTKEYIVFVIPVTHELDLKKGAKLAGVKTVEMIPVKHILMITGYVRGGCSPIGLKKNYRTFFHESAKTFDTIMFSGGKIGLQIKMAPQHVLEFVHGQCGNLIKA